MRVNFQCTGCQQMINVGTQDCGFDVSCPYCGTVQRAPNKPNQMAVGGKPGGALGAGCLQLTVITIVCVVFMGLLAPVGTILLTILALFALFWGIGYLVTNVGSDLWHRNDPHYQEYRASGGNPFFDNAGLSNPPMDYKLPYPEPPYTNFRPPRSWAYQCLSCYCRVEHPHGSCWNCGGNLGANQPQNQPRFPMDEGFDDIGMPMG